MTKKLLALAALGSLAVPFAAHAEGTSPTIYGTINMDLENVKATGSASGTGDIVGRNRVLNDTSNFGFKGAEDLGNDNKVLWQIEIGIAPNINYTPATPAAGAALPADSFFTARNTGIGLTGSWGTAMYGMWDTPFKVADLNIQPFWATGPASMASIFDSPGSNTAAITTGFAGDAAGNALAFNRRQGNTVQYWTPTFYGVTGKLMYGADVNRSAAGNPDLWSASATYDVSPFYASFAWEQHHDFGSQTSFTGTGAATATTLSTGLVGPVSQTDTGYKLIAGVKFGDTSLNGGLNWLSYKNSDGASTSNSYKRMAYEITLLHKINEITIRLGWAQAGAGSYDQNGTSIDTTDTGAKQLALGASYSLSAKSDVYAMYTKLWNGGNANYTFAVGTPGTIALGADLQAFGLGFRTTF